MDRPNELMKLYTNRLVNMLMDKDNAEIINLMHQLQLIGSPSQSEVHSSVDLDVEKQTMIGIWEQKSDSENKTFVRSPKKYLDWNFWSNISQIEPKRAKKRIVLLGESVARGYFYDPIYNPSIELETILKRYLDAGSVEVLDLARTDLNMEQLLELLKSVPLVEPDALVIFSGNNWLPFDFWEKPNSEAYLEAAVRLKEAGISGLKAYFENEIKQKVKQLFRSASEIYEKLEIPVVFIVPEFNLSDWKDPCMSALWLLDGGNKEWIEGVEKALKLYAEGEWDQVIEIAKHLVSLDHGTCGTALYLLSKCYSHKGLDKKARYYAERARDSVIVYPKVNTPRVLSVIQKTMYEEATRYKNITLVDLPSIFSEFLKGALPGRELFMDYCHLTARGIKLTMQHTAAYLLPLLGYQKVVNDETFSNMNVIKDTYVEGEAHFLAAMHNAHWGQDYEIIFYHCHEAIKKAPEIAETMMLYLELQDKRVPVWMRKALEKIIKNISPSRQRYLMNNTSIFQDKLLFDAIKKALGEINSNVPEHYQLNWNKIHSVNDQNINLLDRYYSIRSISHPESNWNLESLADHVKRKGFYQAFTRTSSFCFIAEKNTSVTFHFTCRLLDSGDLHKKIRLQCNGIEMMNEVVHDVWTDFVLKIDESYINEGINELHVVWPNIEDKGQHYIEEAVRDLEFGLYPELLPVFGEIHQLTVTTQFKERGQLVEDAALIMLKG